MVQHGKSNEEATDSFRPTSVILPSQVTPVDPKAPKHMQNPSALHAVKKDSPLEEDGSFFRSDKANPRAVPIVDPLCKLNLKETSEFVRVSPMPSKSYKEGRNHIEVSAHRRREGVMSVGQRRLDTPSTPGRPVFGLGGTNLARKSVPSKWDDAEKWLISTSCHESPAHVAKASEQPRLSNQSEVFRQKGGDAFPETFKPSEEKLQRSMTTGFRDLSLEPNLGVHGFSDVFLKDKFTEKVEPILPCFQYKAPSQESILLSDSLSDEMKDASTEVLAVAEVHRRDVGTEMTPFGSSVTTRCHTPVKVPSPPRHNTPADRSGLLVPPKPSIDIHLTKLDLSAQFDLMASAWSSKEEEEEEVSKSLRHFEVGCGTKSIAESRVSVWEDGEKTKSCVRYQREEARIQAWLNLQSAKAEAQSRKLEVKIQKMRSTLEERLMKRMANVHKRAEEWRAAAQLQHSEQIQRAQEQAEKMKSRNPSRFHGNPKCGCLPCNNHS